MVYATALIASEAGSGQPERRAPGPSLADKVQRVPPAREKYEWAV